MRSSRTALRLAPSLVGAWVSVALLGLPGCGGAEGEGETEAATDGASRPNAAVELLDAERARVGEAGRAAERTLVVGLRTVPRTFDPLGELDPWARRVVDDLLFEGLTKARPDAAPFAAPALADACVVDPPSGAVRDVYCHLPPEAAFHDGTAVEMEDVVFSLEFWLDPRRATLRMRHGLDDLRAIEVVDRPFGSPELRDAGRWVRIGFERPEPLALERVAAMKIVPRKRRRGKGKAFGADPIGTGPMQLISVEDDRVVFERVASGEDPADASAVQRLVLLELPDGAAGLTQLRRGDVHVLASVSPSHIPVELGKPGMAPRFEAFLLSPPQFDVVMFNLRNGAQSGPRMREVLDASIPRGALAARTPMPPAAAETSVDLTEPTPIDLAVLAEAGVSVDWGMAGLPQRPAHDDEAAAAEAAVALDALGWGLERGVRRKATGNLRLVLMWNGAAGRGRDLATTLKEGWKGLGVQVPYATAGWPYLFGLMRKGEFDLALVRLVTHSDADLYPWFHSRGAHNITGVADAALDSALEAFRSAQTRADRQAAKAAVARRLVELRPVSLLHAPSEVMLMSRRVHGVRFVDDKPQLAELRLGAERSWLAGGEP